MKFTIDFRKGLFSERRLKVDNTFKEIIDEKKLHEDDLLFGEYSDARLWVDYNPTVTIEGVSYETGNSARKVGTPIIYIKFHRLTKPKKHLATKEEINEVLRNGDNEKYNMLVIDFDGQPKLIQDVHRGYAVRFEGYGAKGNYVGRGISQHHVNKTYKLYLEAWLLHLTSGQMVFKDHLLDDSSEDELISKIKNAISKYR